MKTQRKEYVSSDVLEEEEGPEKNKNKETSRAGLKARHIFSTFWQEA